MTEAVDLRFDQVDRKNFEQALTLKSDGSIDWEKCGDWAPKFNQGGMLSQLTYRLSGETINVNGEPDDAKAVNYLWKLQDNGIVMQAKCRDLQAPETTPVRAIDLWLTNNGTAW